MQTSIATVSLSGGLAEKLEATAAAGFTGVEIFESDLLSFNGTPKDVARMVARARPEDRDVPAVPRFRGHAGAAAQPHLRPRRAQVRSDGRARLRPVDDLQQCRAGFARRHRPRGGGFPRAWRARAEARHPRRLRGAGVGQAHQRLPRLLGGGAPRRPSGDRADARQLPHLLAQDRPQGDPFDSRATRSCWSSLPTRRGSTWM